MLQGLKIELHSLWSPDPVLYNCSGRTLDEWYSRGKHEPLKGSLTFGAGCVILPTYILIIYSMSSREFLKLSCNQIMYYSAVCDLVNAFFSYIVSGYYQFTGTNFLTSPAVNYAMGCGATSVWSGMHVAVITLALNRLTEIYGHCEWMFRGKMVGFWICVSLSSVLFITFFTKQTFYNSLVGSWLFIPFIDDDLVKEESIYRNYYIPLSNMITANSILLAYVLIFFYFRRTETVTGSHKFSALQKRLLIQCTIICLTLCATCYLFTHAFLFGAPWIAPFCQLGYELNECAPIISYLCFNSYVQTRVFSMLRLNRLNHLMSAHPLLRSQRQQ